MNEVILVNLPLATHRELPEELVALSGLPVDGPEEDFLVADDMDSYDGHYDWWDITEE
jgi:hypothetical protein